MSQNPNTILPPSAQNNYYHSPVKQPPLTGNQAFGSLPSHPTPNSNQPIRPLIQNAPVGGAHMNPNGLTNSPGASPSPYAPSPVFRSHLPNNVHNNASSLNSSRNSSPAMNHSSVSHSPIPQAQPSTHSNAYHQNFPQQPLGQVQLPPSSLSQPPRIVGNPQPLSGPRPPSGVLPPMGGINSVGSSNANFTPIPQSQATFTQPQPKPLPPAQVALAPQPQMNKNVFTSTTQNIPNRYQQSQINTSVSSMPNHFQQNNSQIAPSTVGNQSAVPPYTSGPSSQPFPSRQINSNMPPLVSNQGPAAANFQNLSSFPSQIPTSAYSQPGIIHPGPPPLNNLPPTSNSQNIQSQMPPQFPVNNMQYPPISNVSNQPPSGLHQTYPPSNLPPHSMNQSNLPPRTMNQPNLPPVLPPGYPPVPPPSQGNYISQPGMPQYPPGPQQPPTQYPPGPQQPSNQYPPGQQYPAPNQFNGQPALTQQMGKLSVTQTSFGKMWGQETVDLMHCRNILPEEKLEVPPIKLNHQFAQSVNCSPDIFRCTVNKIPETNSLLQKSRLPLGILIHPFKDLNHLPVIQCSSIVRCRACRTYINPFVYFVDLKRWKCNLCYRVNDLPEEFQYDPVTKSYGDPTRRPEIQSATIEYIASSEYMLRPPQPAAYLFVLDVSATAADSGYLQIVCETLAEHIDSLPGDTRTQLAFICFDRAVHFYFLGEGATRPREMTVIDIDDIFLPSPEDLLVNLSERKTAILELLAALPTRHASPSPSSTQSALGAALQVGHKLMAPTGGRITVLQTCLPNIGPGALTAREDPNNRSSKDVAHLNPATDFYKRLALDCSGVQVAVDFFLLNSQYADLSTLSGISRFSGGSVYHIPLFKASREWQAKELRRYLTRYLTRKIGLEAVMRVRCTRGLAIHAFHGSFFVRSTDLLSLPNVSPDSGFGMQLSIEENLTDVQHVCFQAALLYTSSKGERRIRVHTLCLPVVNTISDVIHSADQQCIIGLLAKMAVDRSQSSSLSDAREALINVAVDALGAQRLSSGPSLGLLAPMSLRLLPLYLLALLKHPAFRTGTSTRLDDRVAAMCNMKSLPLVNLMRAVYPDLYPVHCLAEYVGSAPTPQGDSEAEEVVVPTPPRLHLSAEKVNSTGAYLLDQEDVMLMYVGHAVDAQWLQNALGVDRHSHIEDWHSIPTLETEENALLHAFIDHLNDDRPQAASIHVITDNSANRTLFTEKLLDDRVESALSYYEFLQHIKSQMK